jgi:hypothetical protein
MPKEKLNSLVELWDKEEYEKIVQDGFPSDPKEHEQSKFLENRHRKILEEILFREKYFFGDYELHSYSNFMKIFLDWISQFNGKIEGMEGDMLNHEKRYAFILARNILYFNRKQIISLLKTIWDRIRKELLDDVIKNESLKITDVLFRADIVTDKLLESVFVPLSDSSHFMEFRHHCLPERQSGNLIIPCIDRLMLPIDIKSNHIINEIKNNYRNKKNLFVIEDFSGSGTTAKKLLKIIKNYDFENVYFCPCVITNTAENKLGELKQEARKLDKVFKILQGITIDNEYSIADDATSDMWGDEEKRILRQISNKYFKSHFKDNVYLYYDFNKKPPQKPTPYGFRNGGFTIVLYSNCPNNSLPIIWANSVWKPLFRRYERYLKRLPK